MSLYCPLEFAPAYFSVNCLLSLLSSCLSGLLRMPVPTMWRGPYRRRYMFCVLEVTLESLYHRLQCRACALGTVLCSLSARAPFVSGALPQLLATGGTAPTGVVPTFCGLDFVLASLSTLRSVLPHIFTGLAFSLCSLSYLSGLLRSMLAACGPVPPWCQLRYRS